MKQNKGNVENWRTNGPIYLQNTLLKPQVDFQSELKPKFDILL